MDRCLFHSWIQKKLWRGMIMRGVTAIRQCTRCREIQIRKPWYEGWETSIRGRKHVNTDSEKAAQLNMELRPNL